MTLCVRGAAISVRTWCRIGRPMPRRAHPDYPRPYSTTEGHLDAECAKKRLRTRRSVSLIRESRAELEKKLAEALEQQTVTSEVPQGNQPRGLIELVPRLAISSPLDSQLFCVSIVSSVCTVKAPV